MFHQKGTNHSGGVMIAVGKHLKAMRLDVDVENTIVVDVIGLSEQIRLTGIYWPHGQKRKLDDLRPYLVKGTILTGDFNATAEAWGSKAADRRGGELKKWIEGNNLNFVASTAHSSRRSDRHIDLTFTNISSASCETLFLGTSDHWPTVLTTHSIGFLTKGVFPQTNWRAYQAVLVLLEEYWVRELKNHGSDQWYQNYIRFLAALKGRLTRWKEVEKYRPALPTYIIDQLREVRQVRNMYYRERRQSTVGNEDLRIILRRMSSDVRKEISKYKFTRWASFL